MMPLGTVGPLVWTAGPLGTAGTAGGGPLGVAGAWTLRCGVAGGRRGSPGVAGAWTLRWGDLDLSLAFEESLWWVPLVQSTNFAEKVVSLPGAPEWIYVLHPQVKLLHRSEFMTILRKPLGATAGSRRGLDIESQSCH